MSTQNPGLAAAFSLLAVACLTIMVGCVVVPGLPSIAQNLGVASAASWLVTLPALGVVLFGPVAGHLIDRLGAYRMLCAGLFAYGLLGVAAVALHGMWLVFANRLLLGAATAVVMTSGTALISAFYSGPDRLTMIARQGMTIELGGVIFIALGGQLASLGWRWPFVLYLFAWLMLGMVLCCVPRPPAARDNPRPTAQARRLSATLKTVYLLALAAMTIFFFAVVKLPIHLHALGYSEPQTGYFLSFISLVAVGAAFVMPRVVSRLGNFSTLAVAFLFFAVAHGLFAWVGSTAWLLLCCIAMGTGFGLSVPLVNHMTVEGSAAEVRGRNLSYLSVAIFLGQFLASFSDFIPGPPTVALCIAGAASVVVAGSIGVARGLVTSGATR